MHHAFKQTNPATIYIECFEYALKKYTFRTKVFSTQRVNTGSGGQSNSRKHFSICKPNWVTFVMVSKTKSNRYFLY